MSTPILPPEFRGTPAGTPATTAVSAALPNPPPPVRALPVGSLVTGTVVSQSEPGHFVIRSDQGTFPLTTRAALEVGAQVTLQVRTRGAQVQVTITEIDGKPAHTRLPHPPAATASAPPPGGAAAPPSGSGGPLAGSPPVNGTTPAQTDRISLSTGLAARLAGPQSGPGAPAGPLNSAPLPTGTLDVPARLIPLLAEGAPRSGLVLASPDGQPPRIQTNVGTFGFAGTPGLEPGSTVRVVVRSTGPPLQVLLEPTSANRAGQTPPQQPTTVEAAAGRTDVLALGQRLRAVVQAPGAELSSAGRIAATPPGSAAPTTATAPLPIGTSLDVRILPAGTVPSTSGSPTNPVQATGGAAVSAPVPAAALAANQTPSQGPAQSPALGGTAIPTPAGGTAAALLGASASTQGIPSQTPATGLSVAASFSAAETLVQTTGTIIGVSGQGRPLLQTPVAVLALELRTPLPVGAQFAVELLSAHQSPLAVSARAEPIALTQTWPALEQALLFSQDAVASLSAAEAARSPFITGQVPQPGPKLTSSLLFFLAALSGGDAGAWLQGLFTARGRELLESQGRGDLLARLAQDFGQLGRMADLAGPDWRFLPIPLHDGQQVQQLRLFLRRRQKRQDGSDGDRGEATRFIVEVKLSRVGDLQLDGLVRENRFDLMLRTRKALPPPMRHRIIEIFETAKGAAGYLGNVGFQASDDWTPMPLADGATGPQSLVI